ncbi:zinc-dependent alcohol dehydrogenase [Agromyces kandeliae]|nr:alcohol dehydrogenase catalytic domain-containing protein [Agromyces kandeliae]
MTGARSASWTPPSCSWFCERVRKDAQTEDALASTTMTAAVLGDPGEIEVRTVPRPVPGPDEVLVEVRRASLCGTDVKIRSHAFFDGGRPPSADFIPGHEYAGVVAEVGSSVDEFAPGDRVVTEAHRGCMRCANCLRGAYTDCLNYGDRSKGHRAQGMTVNGGFAQYALNHVSTLTRLPDAVSFDEAVLLTTAGTVMHAFDVVPRMLVGATVAVIGPGPIGLIAVKIARELGAAKVVLVGTRAERLLIGTDLGADMVVDGRLPDAVERVRAAFGGVGADIVLECSGAAAAVDPALLMCKRGGDVVLVGFFGAPVTADLNRAVTSGITLRTVRGEGSGSVARAVALATRGRLPLGGLITHRFPLERIDEAFATYIERRGGAIKVMLDLPEPSSADERPA